ncbi:hypothetical protein N7539_001883 [Penicillium diatomitis]|uniref:Uncharacterized protein n=1 Tax=Penicillium diatomitis TaxID=2819901 RepID=A0A9W9XHI9_9EURO|nr:uncharacterized protein N7539_001883 [Penicillium diatomitis]KAJ5493137.1 hypothetical protein N7539_001883 [Penicillium diatomitis]
MSANENESAQVISKTNGETQLESLVGATTAKRKRSAQDENLGVESHVSIPSHEKASLHENLRGLVGLLIAHDDELHVLSYPFPSSGSKQRTKRAKTSNEPETTNVKLRVESDRYNTLQEFLADIEKATGAIIDRAQNQAQSNGSKPDGTTLTEVVSRIAAFKKHMNGLIGQSFVNHAEVKAEQSEDDAEQSAENLASIPNVREDRQALTFFGSLPSQPGHPKQLFSSLQKSVKLSPKASELEAEKFAEAQESLREAALPAGVMCTKVVPRNLDCAVPKKRTFGEVFVPRAGLPALQPPQARSHQSSTLSWIDPFDAVFDTRNFIGDRSSYCLTPLPAGHWLQYGGVVSSPSYWARVEKSHAEARSSPGHGDPAIWTGGDSTTLQGVYSSFAPSYDSSGAVLQNDAKDLMWWGTRGANRLRTMLSTNDEEVITPTVQPGSIGDLDESTLEEMVKQFNPEDFVYDRTQDEPSKEQVEDREVDEVLQEISEMLDTLSSYQKIRNLQPPPSKDEMTATNEGTTAAPKNSVEIPSEAEQTVYETLKAALVAIIANLPPFAVAKLNGNQLDELNISQKIVIENPDYSGTMEKDDYTLNQERAAAIAAAAATNAAAAASNSMNRHSTPSSARAGYQQNTQASYAQRAMPANSQMSQTQPRYHQITQQVRQGSVGGSFNVAQTAHRAPTTPSQRPGYMPPQYSQPNPQYNQVGNTPQFQRAPSNGYAQSPQPYTPQPGQAPPAYHAAPQQRTPYANAGVPQPFPSANRAPPPAMNSAASAMYARNAADKHQAAKAQLAAQLATQSRQSPSTPQPHNPDARPSQEGSMTPGKQNGTPMPQQQTS